MMITAVLGLLVAADGVITATYAQRDPGFDMNPQSAFWAKAEVAKFHKGPRGDHPRRPPLPHG